MWESFKEDWAYKDFHFRDITKPQYRHILMLLYWPVFLVLFFVVGGIAEKGDYYVVHCALDDMIPFCEYFIIPYVVWYPLWVLMVLYTLGFEVPTYIRFMKYLMVTLSLSLSIYILWPNGQNMWPDPMPRDNFFTWLVGLIYKADHCTNVCPSEHVSTAFGVVFAAMDSKRFSGKRSIAFWIIAIMITLSVSFIKQHSVLDILAAIPVILLGYFLAFFPKHMKNKVENKEEE